MPLCQFTMLALGTLTWVLLITLGILVLLAIVLVPHNLCIRRVCEAYATLPGTARERAVELIETAAAGGSAFTLYRFAADLPEVDSYVGGSPWCNPGDVPPPDSKHLLIQIRLDEPSLGPAWRGRIVQVFITDDWQTPTRSMPGLNRDGVVGTLPEPLPRVALRPMRMPLPPEPDPNSDEDDGLANPTWLLNNVPGLRALLSSHHRDVQGLLAQILGPGTYGYAVDAPDLIYSGGRPLLIQNPHDATCPVCSKPMRLPPAVRRRHRRHHPRRRGRVLRLRLRRTSRSLRGICR